MRNLPFNKLEKSVQEQIRQVDELTDIYVKDQEILFNIVCDEGYLKAYISFKKFEFLNVYMLYSFERNQGYATHLLNTLQGNISLEVDNTNISAISLYQKNKFKLEHKIDNNNDLYVRLENDY